MLKSRIIYLIALMFLVASCGGDTLNSVKRGLTGEKSKSTDEFLVQKKDPLILPPDFESLPSPSDRIEAGEEISIFEKALTKNSPTESATSTSDSLEESILKKIPKASSASSSSSVESSTEESILKRIQK